MPAFQFFIRPVCFQQKLLSACLLFWIGELYLLFKLNRAEIWTPFRKVIVLFDWN